MPRPCVEKFGYALPRDGRRKPLTFDVVHRLVALDRVKPSVRKRYKCAHGDKSFDDQFVAIKWVATLARDVGTDTVNSHDAPLRSYATCARRRSSDQGIREMQIVWALTSRIHAAWRGSLARNR